MHLVHPTIVHFAVAFFVASMVTEGIAMFTGKKFWALVAKYHILAAAVMSFIAVLTGFVDYKVIFMNETAYRFIKSHTLIGFLVFIIIQLMANYKYLMEKMLPEKYKMIYLIVGGLGIGLVFGASFLGKAAVYSHGAGVSIAMLNYYDTEKYLKELYGLNSLADPTREDSLRAAEFFPGPEKEHGESDTLAQHAEKSGHEKEMEHYEPITILPDSNQAKQDEHHGNTTHNEQTDDPTHHEPEHDEPSSQGHH